MPTATVNLTGFISQKMNPIFRPLVADRTPLQVLVGGANSSKSYSYAQKVIYHTLTEKYSRYLALRKVKKDVKHSVYDTLREVIVNSNLEGLFKYNDTESNITCKINNNDILGVGLDDVNKLKSFNNPTGFWAEEADQMIPDDIQQLELRLRGPQGCLLQGGLTFNPISAQHWIKLKYFNNKLPNVLTHHSTYKDNIFLTDAIIKRMEAITDPYYYKVYVLGEWGIFSNGVFSNYIIEDFDYTEDDLENVSNGVDFGFAHASSLERCGFKDGELYFFDETYGKGWVNKDFMDAIVNQYGDVVYSWPITADSAEPDRIEEFRRSGFRNINEAKKGPGSLKYGVDYLVSKKIHIHASKCPNLAREIQLFKRRVDKDGNAIDAFVEINDDCIAAARYATEYIWSNTGMVYYEPTYSLGDLGL